MKTNKTAEIYIHIPFCKRKCDYCDFVSFVTDSDTRNRYFDMLIKEIEIKSESMGNLPIDSVFIGGGTPSLVDSYNISRVMETIRRRFCLTDNPEISIESNPNSSSYDKFKDYIKAGINRLSIGLQSTDDTELKNLSRLHNYSEFLTAFDDARNAGFININVDLMSAVPGQSVQSYEKSLRRIADLNPEHISAYSLIIEEGTPFYDLYGDNLAVSEKSNCGSDSVIIPLPSEDEERLMYHMTQDILEASGYLRYEISNYAKSGYECRHNTGYWRRVPYIGFGIAAASLYGDVRYQKHSNLNKYLNGDFTETRTNIDLTDSMEEFMFLGLRMTSGVSKDEFNRQFGRDIYSEYGKPISKLIGEGLLKDEDGRIFLTLKGLDVANYCMAEFIH